MKRVFIMKRSDSGKSGVFRSIAVALLIVGCVGLSAVNAGAKAESKVKVKADNKTTKKILIYTKNGKGFVHKNIPASIVGLKEICKRNGWACEVSDDPAIFNTYKKISEFEVLVFSNTNNETFDTDAQKKVFQEYIHGGGGFVAIHSACASERQWPWYWANVGCKFVYHPKFQKFDVKVVSKDHPSTEFLPDIWKWEDECYVLDHFSLTMKVLLAADLRTIESKRLETYPGKTFGDYLPLCWCQEFEGGRQWYTALGHAPEHFKDANYLKHIEGGIKWAMGKK